MLASISVWILYTQLCIPQPHSVDGASSCRWIPAESPPEVYLSKLECMEAYRIIPGYADGLQCRKIEIELKQ